MRRSTSANLRAAGPALPAPRERRWPRRRTGLVLAFPLLLALTLAHRPLLTRFARLFRANDPAPSDALLVLEGSAEPVALYQRGWARQVLLVPSGLQPFPDLNPFEVDRQVLIRRGIPAEAIRVLRPVRYGASVREIAQRVREDVLRHPIQRLTIAAGAAQTARYQRVFRRALRGTGVDVRMAAVRNPGFDESTWYRKDEGLTEYFSEVISVLRDQVAL